MQKQWKKSSNR